jgi:hypothetical protein
MTSSGHWQSETLAWTLLSEPRTPAKRISPRVTLSRRNASARTERANLTSENKATETDRSIGGSVDVGGWIQGIHTASAGTKQLMMMIPR